MRKKIKKSEKKKKKITKSINKLKKKIILKETDIVRYQDVYGRVL